MKAKMDLKEKKSQQVAIKSVTDLKYHVMRVKDIFNISKCKNTNHTKVTWGGSYPGTIECTLTIADFEAILPNNFHRIDRSNIINLDYVVFYDSDFVLIERIVDQKYFPHVNSITQKIVEL